MLEQNEEPVWGVRQRQRGCWIYGCGKKNREKLEELLLASGVWYEMGRCWGSRWRMRVLVDVNKILRILEEAGYIIERRKRLRGLTL